MMHLKRRFQQVQKNTGTEGVLRLLLVSILFTGITVYAAIDDNTLSWLGIWLVAWVLPTLFRRHLTQRPEQTSRWLERTQKALFGFMLVVGIGRSVLQIPVTGVETIPFTILVAMTGLYLSSFFWLWSDPFIMALPSTEEPHHQPIKQKSVVSFEHSDVAH